LNEAAEDICNKFVMEALRMHHYLPHYTWDDYCQWEGRWELIDGIPIAMSPLPIEQHQIVASNLYLIFKLTLKGKCDACRAVPPIDWKVKEDTVLQPDFLVICGPALGKGPLAFSPALTAEVLSPSTAVKDRNAKFKIYQEQGVKYYLILDIRLKKLEVYELVNAQYQLASVNPSSFDFSFHDDCSVSVPFDEVWD
jgi:Uma2 family endonuclease